MRKAKWLVLLFLWLITWREEAPEYETSYVTHINGFTKQEVPTGKIKTTYKMELHQKSEDIERRLDDIRKHKDVKVYRLEPYGWKYEGGARLFKKQ